MTEKTDLCKHGDDAVCQICESMPWSIITELNRQRKRINNHRRSRAPLRKRRKRLHKKLAKRGFSGSPCYIIWSDNTPGYGTKGTKYDFFFGL